MNTRVKLGIFWGAIVAAIIVGINFFRHLLGGHRDFYGGPNGFRSEGWGRRGGFRQQQFMNGPHHGGDFHLFGPLLFLIIGLAVLVLLVRWLRRKAKASSMERFIETPLMSSHTPVINHNARILDQWEKNLTNEKEIE
ncbi:hypothetical protein [Neobacillus ginsengisoli]|uniref:H+/Cl- antiporter ClcA n=1 Tax=Neobacillus ginsengisoli TaxID=904295 RepID=A0ABT9XUY9_9BACI|nr:hypothetical protein [Neobacillus ginsengisoli]MDQ0199183.1 H+/Cl- antiporter ClcA [Neobacillus ginsengisoli]